MAGFRTVESIEIRPGEARMEEIKDVDRKVDPFLHVPLPVAGQAAGTSYEGSRSDGMKDFLAIGEKGGGAELKDNANLVRYDEKARDAKVQEAVQDPSLPNNSSTEITGARSLLENVAFYFKKAMGFMGGGLGGPMMIFSFMLRPGDTLEIHNAREFSDVLHLYNDKLKAFDEVSALSRSGQQLTPQQEKFLQNPETIDLNKQRLQMVKDNYQFHTLETANEPSSDVLDHLQAHLKADDYGSHFQFGEGEVFKDPSALLELVEDFLGKAYRGELKQGSTFPFLVRTASGDVIGARIRFSPANDMQNGVPVGPSSPGGRVVIGIEFDQPIGKDAIVETYPGQETRSVTRTSGGRNESIRVLDGEKQNTYMMYIIGGSYGPTGKFGLYTVYSGRYAPPISDSAFWSQHAFLSGKPK